MLSSELEIFAQRLKNSQLARPWTNVWAGIVLFLNREPKDSLAANIPSVTRNRSRAYRTSWLWPCHLIPQVEAALQNPTSERCAVIDEFFKAVALVDHLQTRPQLKRELAGVFPDEFPFTLIAIAQIARRSRSLTPRPLARLARDISDVEARLAWQLWQIASKVRSELLAAFETNEIAKACSHCEHLMLDMERKYCSAPCRKAHHNAREYRKRNAKVDST